MAQQTFGQSCANCAYFIPHTVQGVLYTFCRRFPPVPIQDKQAQGDMYQSAWPMTKPEYWCSEFTSSAAATIPIPTPL
jgi:hypothetical protein